MAPPVYHLELRAFPHVARVFNLDRAELDERFLAPWSAGRMIEHDERRWPAEKTKLTVLRGPELAASARGLGRGWGEATRGGEDVTETVLAEIRRGAEARPELESLKDALAQSAGGTGIRCADAVALAAAAHPGWRVSEQLALAEQAVWEMLHRHRLELVSAAGEVIGAAGWAEAVLSWETWARGADAEGGLRLRAPRSPPDGD